MSFTIEQLETLVRSGELARVARALRDTNTKNIARADLARYAQLANRVGQARFTLRVLHPIVRSDNPAITKPTDAEKLEYAAALRLNGIFREAITLLGEIDRVKTPIVHLRTASCLMSQWKYAEAIPWLRTFIELSDKNDYQHVIARVNLAAALVCEYQDEEAWHFLTDLVRDTRKAGQNLLCGNSLELMAQLLIRKSRYDKAEQVLDEASALFTGNTRYELYLRKWHAVARSQKAGKVHADLIICRAEAANQMEWETVRDCDLYIAAIGRDIALLNQVYVGTPFDSYRKRVQNLAGSDFTPPKYLVWKTHSDSTPKRIFDVIEGRASDSENGLDRGRLMHKTLIHLASDFYRPITLGSAFAELFPGENYAQEGRAERVHQSIRRLRVWFEEQNIPVDVLHSHGNYRLSFSQEIGILVPTEAPELTVEAVSWKKLKARLPSKSFSKRDIMAALDCSNASAKRLIKWAVDSGQVQVLGSGPQRKYRPCA